MSDEKKQDVAPEAVEEKKEDAKVEEAKANASTAPTDDAKSDDKKDDSAKEVAVPAKFKSLVEKIEKMSVMDLAELVKILEDKFGVSAAAPVAAMAAGPAEPVEEKTEFDVEFAAPGENKIASIKVVKEITGLGLKEAKDLVDAAPKVLKEKVKKEEAEEMKKKLEEAGATVNLK